ncbi:MAG TPA: HAD family hydrolase [Marinilabiliales bacterium]|nr:MAG: hypothetical protein A2W84_02545 [Bacteroidetes bacterium GWC2_40_13]OFX75602.1 MAG: hypothetical protein A2W96_08975 [Bacteroidetes bacterium GWD2_40_43]OFX90679.1 MAG: hypothetical protein A2W97_02820 [Bacteroidetes bacterium GWE2_40_63]OFY20842.1 MAG: hypothetical protein A2W88_17445 [Bacteroidetes bacterium GWF2_40_13]OFZ23738.1 MAG: hypothetical protein A2437_06810 [Bacteroidetes bacterium RIFOXYC2_FULL_40_12]HAN00616.1 HAD family hydrolase [Marinilabiliales bacterium]
MPPYKNYELIIWDWNGTLLDDRDICITSMNHLLSERNLPTLDLQRYREVFTFPVKDYYQRLGFDFDREPFEIPALEFMDQYHLRLHQATLFPDAVPVLTSIQQAGYGQMILSAMEQESLITTVINLGIEPFFEEVAGISDQYAHGKIGRAIELLKQKDILPHRSLLIGDTLHDAEVAGKLGCQCLLVSRGHQSAHRLLASGWPVVESLSQVLQCL